MGIHEQRYAKKFTKAGDKVLFADETVLTGGWCQHAGAFREGVAKAAVIGGVGALGGLAAVAGVVIPSTTHTSHNSSGDTTEYLATRWPEGKHLIALTDRRLIAAPLGRRVNTLSASYDLADIVHLDREVVGMVARLAIHFHDGSMVQLEAFAEEIHDLFRDARQMRAA